MPDDDVSTLQRTVTVRIFQTQLAILVVASAIVAVLYICDSPQLGSMVFAFLAGNLGGSIALARRLPKSDERSLGLLASGWIHTLMPILYGGLMAGVAYLLFMSGILTGEISAKELTAIGTEEKELVDVVSDKSKGLFRSNLFPNFEMQGEYADKAASTDTLSMRAVLSIRPVDVVDFGKLLVWCFLAGFSERFVLDILRALERRGSSSGTRSG